MRSKTEHEYLLKAIDAFQRRLIVVSPDFTILAANCPTNDICESDMVGAKCHHVFHDRDSPCENCAVQEAKDSGKPTLSPQPLSSLDLGRIPCFYSYPIYSGDKLEALVSMDFDIPDSGSIQEKLQKANALLRNLILSAVDGVIAADKKGQILIFNEAASEVFGYTIDEALAELNICDIYPDDIAYEVMAKMRSDDYGGKDQLHSYQVDIMHKSGKRVPISLNAAIVYEKGQEIATIGFFHDLREKIQMQRELEKTQLQLLQSEKMASLGKLAAGVAHQLNNPLGGITLFAKLIMEEYELADGAKEDLNRILKDAERCRDTVKELLEFSRQTRYLMQPQNINQAINRTLFLIENQTLFHNIQIEKALAQSLPLVSVDIQQINHLFMNIILNAAQAMEGNGTLSICSFLTESEQQVRIEIADTGPGIPQHILPRIFEPFFTTKQEGEGTGLGLSLVYSIVENHGGTIRASSQVGDGTKFIIELPIRASETQGEDREQ